LDGRQILHKLFVQTGADAGRLAHLPAECQLFLKEIVQNRSQRIVEAVLGGIWVWSGRLGRAAVSSRAGS
jgi:hypothetical protein